MIEPYAWIYFTRLALERRLLTSDLESGLGNHIDKSQGTSEEQPFISEHMRTWHWTVSWVASTCYKAHVWLLTQLHSPL